MWCIIFRIQFLSWEDKHIDGIIIYEFYDRIIIELYTYLSSVKREFIETSENKNPQISVLRVLVIRKDNSEKYTNISKPFDEVRSFPMYSEIFEKAAEMATSEPVAQTSAMDLMCTKLHKVLNKHFRLPIILWNTKVTDFSPNPSDSRLSDKTHFSTLALSVNLFYFLLQ